MSHRRSPRRLDQALSLLTDDVAPQTVLADVQRAWPEAVGPLIAAQAEPTAARGGVITVSCSASVWAHELNLMAPQIIARLNDGLGGFDVSRLRCVAVGR